MVRFLSLMNADHGSVENRNSANVVVIGLTAQNQRAYECISSPKDF